MKHSGTVSLTWNGRIARSPFSLQIAGRMNSPKLYQQIITGSDGSQTVSMEESDPYSIWKIVLVKPFRINKHTIEVTCSTSARPLSWTRAASSSSEYATHSNSQFNNQKQR